MMDPFTSQRSPWDEHLVRYSREVIRASRELLERTAAPITRDAATQRRALAAASVLHDGGHYQSTLDAPPSRPKPEGQQHLG